MRGLAAFVMRGPVQAGLVGALSLVFSLTWLAGAPVALYALRKGHVAGVTAAGVATVSAIALFWASLGRPGMGLLFALALWVPVLGIAGLLRVSVRLDLSILAAGAFGVVLLMALHLAVDDPTDLWYQFLSRAEGLQAVMGIPAADVDAETQQAILRRIAAVMSGFAGAAYSANMVVSLLLARWWQAILYNPGGFGEEFRQLRLGRIAATVAVAAVGAAWLLQSTLLANAAIVVVSLFLFQGLAVAHGLVKGRNLGRGWLIGLYVLLFMPFGNFGQLIAFVGILDAWVDMRRRWAASPPS